MTLYGAAAALDEENGGGSQPPHRSYSRTVASGLVLLALVLVAGAAAVGLDLYCPAGYKCPFGQSDSVSTTNNIAISSLSEECPPGSDLGLHCITAWDYCTAFCSIGIVVPENQERCRTTCSIALDRCCDN